jgi:hypothetical protein
MGADKNSSLWLNSAYTPIAAPRTHKHKQDPKQGSNNLKGTTKKPRNKSQTNPTRKHNSKRKGLKAIWKAPGGTSVVSGRTVREEGADCPRGGHGPSEIATRTSSIASRKTDRP